MRVFKSKTTRLFSTFFWCWYIYWIPTLMSEYHNKDESVLNNLYISSEDGNYCGSSIEFHIFFFIWSWNIDFWWNLTEKNYER